VYNLKEKNTIFSKNEIAFLKDEGNLPNKTDNYIYQIRHTIKKKIKNFIFNDLTLLLGIRKKDEKIDLKNKLSNLLDYHWLDFLICEVLKLYPNLFFKIIQLDEVKEYLGTYHLEKSIKTLIDEAIHKI